MKRVVISVLGVLVGTVLGALIGVGVVGAVRSPTSQRVSQAIEGTAREVRRTFMQNDGLLYGGAAGLAVSLAVFFMVFGAARKRPQPPQPPPGDDAKKPA